MTSPNIKKEFLGVTAAVLLGVAVMGAALALGIPLGADLDNHFRFAMPFYDELASGNYRPGWLAESNMGFGDARFRFYPPFLYYLLAIGRYGTGEWYSSMLLIFSLLSVAGTVGVYLWTRQSFSIGFSTVSAAVFAVLPYHFAQFYQASLLAEFAALSLLPFSFLFVTRISLARRFSPLDVLGLGVSFSLVVVTHLPSTVIGGIGLGIFALLSTDWRNGKRTLLYSGLGMGLAMLFSSFFWVTMLSELSWIQAGHKVNSDHYDYRKNFVFSPFAHVNLNTWYGSLVAALTFAMFLPALVEMPRIRGRMSNKRTESDEGGERSPRTVLVASVITAAAALLMTTDLSRPVWAIVPKLPDIQFPFRWLSIVSVCVCPAAAYGLYRFVSRVRERSLRTADILAMTFFVLAAVYAFTDLVVDSEFLPRQEFTARIESVRAGPSFADWLPVGAAELKDIERMTGEIDPKGRIILSSRVGTHRRRFSFAEGESVEARIRSYYYPLWRASFLSPRGTTRLETKQAADGTLLVAIPPDAGELVIEFDK